MNKFYFLLFVLFVYFSPSSAQILVGPIVGGQRSWIRFEDKDKLDYYSIKGVWGYHIGANLSFRVRDRFFLHTAFLYSRKGKEIDGKVDGQLRNKVIYKSIDIPVLYTVEFKGNAGGNKSFKWFVGGGPNLSYWLGGKGTIRSTDIIEGGGSDTNYKIVFRKSPEEVANDEMNIEDPNRIQVGVNLVSGIVLEPVGFNKIMITARYEIGHSLLSGTSSGVFPIAADYQDNLRASNQGIRLSVSYLFDLKTDQRKKGKSTSKIKKKRR